MAVARSLASDGRSRVVVAHVNKRMAVRGGSFPFYANEDLLQVKVRQQVASLQSTGLNAELMMQSTFGDTAPALAEIARECGADLIVTGGSRHRRLAGVGSRGVGQQVPRFSPCPVLMVPPSYLTPHFRVLGRPESLASERVGSSRAPH